MTTLLAVLLTTAPLGVPPSLAAADSTYFAGRPAEALEHYRSLLKRAPRDPELLWRAARAALAVGWLEPEEAVSIPWYQVAQEYGRRAVVTAPDHIDAGFWLAASLAREAQIADEARTCVARASEAHGLALRVLARSPDHAGAHNLLGQVHYQVMKTPWALRVLGLRLLGARIPFRASWEEAEEHLVRAVQLDPETIAFRLELGRLYLRTGRRELARPQLSWARRLPRVHPMDALFQQEAADLLEGDG